MVTELDDSRPPTSNAGPLDVTLNWLHQTSNLTAYPPTHILILSYQLLDVSNGYFFPTCFPTKITSTKLLIKKFENERQEQSTEGLVA
jgi:hypothetical protein